MLNLGVENMQGRSRIVTLLTDFGVKDAYVGAMKGVILKICPESTLVDISHEVPRHSISQGAFILSQVSPYFPLGSVHLVVVDPGVGTARRRIIIQSNHQFYVGPDNGVLFLAAEKEGILKTIEIKTGKFMLPHPTRTFEGRDIFAPIAAHLAKGVAIDEFGPEIKDLTPLSISKPKMRDRKLLGEIISIDNFGNITTNIPENLLGKAVEGVSMKVTIGKISVICPLSKTYSEITAGAPLLTVGSSGFIEIAVNQGSAEQLFKTKIGNRLTFTLES